MEKGLPLREQAEAWADEMKRHCCAVGETVLTALLSKFKGNADDVNDVFEEVAMICIPFIDFDPTILSTPKVSEVLQALMNKLFERRSKLVASLASVVDYPWAGIMKEAQDYRDAGMPKLTLFEACVKCYREKTTFESADVMEFMDRLPDHKYVSEISDEWVKCMVAGVALQLNPKSPRGAEYAQVGALNKHYKSLKRKTSEATSDSKRASVTVTEN